VGLNEALEEDYLHYRIASTAFLGNHIAAEGVPIVQPPGGHAIYLDARAFLPHIPPAQFPGVALANELYLEGGIRSVEIGTLMFGEHARMDLVRLAIPRRVYTQSHIEYVVEVILDVWRRRDTIPGYDVVHQAPFLRHFSARLKPPEQPVMKLSIDPGLKKKCPSVALGCVTARVRTGDSSLETSWRTGFVRRRHSEKMPIREQSWRPRRFPPPAPVIVRLARTRRAIADPQRRCFAASSVGNTSQASIPSWTSLISSPWKAGCPSAFTIWPKCRAILFFASAAVAKPIRASENLISTWKTCPCSAMPLGLTEAQQAIRSARW